jgi:glycosyltransferase involved in cell wall biosynthesis
MIKRIQFYLPTILVLAAGFYFLYNLRDLLNPRVKQKPISLLLCQKEAKETKSFVVVIPSFNNAKYCEKNLRSVFEQNYAQFRVIYIDDASTDETFEKVKSLVETSGMQDRVTLLHNEINRGAAANYYRAIHLCKNEEIILMLDGDDWLAHDQVLNCLNLCYNDSNVWMTYGSACEYPSYKRSEAHYPIPESVHEKRNYREFTRDRFLISHLKTAYAGLLKKVKVEDLQFNGQFMPATSDEALMLPAIEMAGKHAHFIRDILYIYNRQSLLNDDKVRFEIQNQCKKYILSLPSYPALEDWRSIQ